LDSNDSSIADLAGLTKLAWLSLSYRKINLALANVPALSTVELSIDELDLAPLVANPDFASGDELCLSGRQYALDCSAVAADVDTLKARGVAVYNFP
jgi:hypothetical protein